MLASRLFFSVSFKQSCSEACANKLTKKRLKCLKPSFPEYFAFGVCPQKTKMLKF